MNCIPASFAPKEGKPSEFVNGIGQQQTLPIIGAKISGQNWEGSMSSSNLLSGGNPQIPKGDGDTPFQAYIDAMPGRKRSIGKQLDELIVRINPNVRKSVK